MADGLAVRHYKDAAAVIAGTSLEVHLKALATKECLELQSPNSTPKKASVLNDELKREGVYSALEHKQVIAWLAIRNSAAHRTYGDYDEAAVKALIEGVGNFAPAERFAGGRPFRPAERNRSGHRNANVLRLERLSLLGAEASTRYSPPWCRT
jgi:hypothetical protein